MATQAARGKQLIDEKNFGDAIVAFTAALKESPTSPVYFTQRALAYQRNKQYPEALADANAAVVYAHKRAKKELIVDAQIRRAVILYNLERYGDARAVLDVAKRMNKDAKEIGTWSAMIAHKVKVLGEEHEKMQVTVKEVPDLDLEALNINASGPTATQGTAKKVPDHDLDAPKVPGSGTMVSVTNGTASGTPSPPAQTPVGQIRYEWYQNNQNVYLTFLAKGVPEDELLFDITGRKLKMSFPVAVSNDTFRFVCDPLYANVDIGKCTTRVLPSKVEIVLAKATPAQKWHQLEGTYADDDAETSTTDSVAGAVHGPPVPIHYPAPPVNRSSPPSGPAYPTSSRNGPKNWDKVGADEDDDDEGDATNSFFKKLYKDASPEVQRAMMKSYTESNGTSLSTNWEEVSKGKVETLPPDGMEAKSWGK
jgi:suppressor of G2 allele of SKP1